MEHVLAVDGRNTKTIACIADLSGSIPGIGQSGCGDMYNSLAAAPHGLSAADFALANIEVTVIQALQAGRIQSATLIARIFNRRREGGAARLQQAFGEEERRSVICYDTREVS